MITPTFTDSGYVWFEECEPEIVVEPWPYDATTVYWPPLPGERDELGEVTEER